MIMATKNAITKAIKIIGLSKMAELLGVSKQAMSGWRDRNRMPDTEYSCRSNYSLTIETATDGQVTVADLLGHLPTCVRDKRS